MPMKRIDCNYVVSTIIIVQILCTTHVERVLVVVVAWVEVVMAWAKMVAVGLRMVQQHLSPHSLEVFVSEGDHRSSFSN